jgi:hypothetical protein
MPTATAGRRSTSDDILIGGNAAQDSDGGDDKLFGGTGNDVLNGQDGARDLLDGGNGTDVAIHALPSDRYTISYGEFEQDNEIYSVRINTALGFDYLKDVEYAFFGTPLGPSSSAVALQRIADAEAKSPVGPQTPPAGSARHLHHPRCPGRGPEGLQSLRGRDQWLRLRILASRPAI